MKEIIWSNFENSPFMEQEGLKEGIDTKELSSEDLIAFIKSKEMLNNRLLQQVVKPQFTRKFNKDIVAVAIINNEQGKKTGQKVWIVGENLRDIFDIPYEYVTWYIDTWNIRAKVYYKGCWYNIAFRELREKTNTKVFFSNVNDSKKLLTPTLMGLNTLTLCLNKRKGGAVKYE